MRIDNVTINVTLPALPPRSAAAESFLTSLVGDLGELTRGIAPASNGTTETTGSPPAIGEVWVGQGGIYAGVSRGEDGAPDAHLILSTEKPSGELAWQAALDWAKTVAADGHTDFHVPTRFESALLYANLRDKHDTDKWHWTSTQSSGNYAWNQGFYYGGQYDYDKKYEGAVRAVRRFSV